MILLWEQDISFGDGGQSCRVGSVAADLEEDHVQSGLMLGVG